MRGKKIDTDFVANFISESAANGLFLNSEIIQRAKNSLSDIDRKIQEAEELKKKRVKLNDVILTLDKKTEENSDKIFLPFFNIKNRALAFGIANQLNSGYMNVQDIKFTSSSKDEIKKTIKQMIALEIINKESKIFSKGMKFSHFILFSRSF